MKGLYVVRYKNSIEYLDKQNKSHVIERHTSGSLYEVYKLHYGSIPSEINKTYFADEIHSIFKECVAGNRMFYGLPLLHVFRRWFTKDKYKVSILGSDPFYSRDDIHIKEENILNIKTVIYVEVLDYSDYSFFTLSQKLSADDFIDFCRDHDVSLVNIFRGEKSE